MGCKMRRLAFINLDKNNQELFTLSSEKNVKINNMWFQKMSILHPQKGLETPGGRGVSKANNFMEMYEA